MFVVNDCLLQYTDTYSHTFIDSYTHTLNYSQARCVSGVEECRIKMLSIVSLSWLSIYSSRLAIDSRNSITFKCSVHSVSVCAYIIYTRHLYARCTRFIVDLSIRNDVIIWPYSYILLHSNGLLSVLLLFW